MPAASVIGVIFSIGFASPAFGQHRGHVGHRGFGRHSGLRNRSFSHQGRLRPHGLGHQRRLHHRSPGHHLRLPHHSRLRNRSFSHHGGLQHHGLRHHLGLSHRSLGHQGNLHHFGFVTGLTYGARYKKSYHNGRDKPIDSDHVEPDTTNQPELDAPTPLKSGLSYLKHRKYQRAAKALLQAVLAEPNAGIPKLALGDALLAGGDYDYAAYAIRRGIDRIGDVEKALTDRKDYFKSPAELDRLLYKLRHYLKEHSQNSDAHFLLGYYEYVAGHWKEANQSFQRALEIDSDDLHAARLEDLASEHS